MSPHEMKTDRASFLTDLFRQATAGEPRIDAGRWCAHNAFVGTILLGGGLVLRVAGPPDPLGAAGFAFLIATSVALIAAAIVPLVRPGLVQVVLALDGVLVTVLTVAFAAACMRWGLEASATRSFRYLPGLITTAATYGASQWADFGPVRAHARRWRLAGFLTGVALDLVVAVVVIAAAIRA